ncbi:MAG: hypothetical protein MJ053_03635 [Elusimicrobiaceae bacterium]|nr:hypothetical protein [Elusimicrobiaceae bacterium]
MAWLAQQIPEDTQYLLLGEIHNPFVMGHISPLMKELRVRFGDRRIILLTEFLEEGDSSTLEDPEKYSGWFSTPLRQKIWTEAQANQISVFGLEPSVVYEHYSDFHFVSEYNHRENVWATNFGVDVRNHAWAKTIEQYHQENPDALIVVYAGINHLAYTSPFSLGLKLKKQAPTFLTSFTLGIPTSQESVLQPISSFDLVTGGVFGQRIVHVAPEDAETAGFNIQLKFIDKYY